MPFGSSSSTRVLPVHAPAAATIVPGVRTRTFLGPFIILLGVVVASGSQTELASYLAGELKYGKSYFSFYVTHSFFSFVFPIHVACLVLFPTPRGAAARTKQLLRGLRAVLADQLGCTARWRVLFRPLCRKIIPLTVLITFPAVCWYVAMVFSPAMDITALYATSAFHAYFFSLLLLGTVLTRTTILAIAVAFAGVIVLTLDGVSPTEMGAGRLLGDVIMSLGAAGLGLYEVVYKMMLPESQGGAAGQPTTPRSRSHTPLPEHDSDRSAAGDDDDDEDAVPLGSAVVASSITPLLPKSPSQPGSPGTSTPPRHVIPLPSPLAPRLSHSHHAHLPPLPTAFHANFLTSAIGVCTLVLFWIPLPFLHWTRWEPFEWPSDGHTALVLAGCASLGSIYNSGLMILIGVWGPTTSSVANLLTIGFVAVVDALWIGRVPSFQTMAGAGMICAGFAALLWEGEEA